MNKERAIKTGVKLVATLGLIGCSALGSYEVQNALSPHPDPSDRFLGEVEVSPECHGVVYESRAVKEKGLSGITLPEDLTGRKTNIYLSPDASQYEYVWAHEIIHSKQFCEKGTIGFFGEYWTGGKDRMEKEADVLGWEIVRGEAHPEIKTQIDALLSPK